MLSIFSKTSQASGLTRAQKAELKELRKEVSELRRAIAILLPASVLFISRTTLTSHLCTTTVTDIHARSQAHYKVRGLLTSRCQTQDSRITPLDLTNYYTNHRPQVPHQPGPDAKYGPIQVAKDT